MNAREYAHSIDSEIKMINRIIDQKIIRGLNYYEDARRHKLLLQQRSKLIKEKRMFRFMSLIF